MSITSFIISLISIFITLFMTIRTLLTERKNLEVEVINRVTSPNKKRVHLNIIFTNKSKNPISITGVSITSNINGKSITRYGRYLQHRVAHTTIKGELTQEITNTTIPISIESYGAIYSLVTLDLIEYQSENFLNENSYITINTSRGKLKEHIYTKDLEVIKFTEMLDFPFTD